MTAGAVCIVCGAPAADDHHLVGARIDGELTAGHCHDHHELVHDDWWTGGVGAKRSLGSQVDQDQPATFLHRLLFALRRLAMWLGRLAERGLFLPVSESLAAALARWAAGLSQCIAALDAELPGWQATPGLAGGHA